MATLSRPAPSLASAANSSAPAPEADLSTSVPAPFPREHLVDAAQSGHQSEPSDSDSLKASTAMTEVVASIAFVEKSCLMTLNNLLSVPSEWRPIVPDRRHSMPTGHPAPSTSSDADSSSPALLTLVSNLRTRESGNEMVQIASSSTDIDHLLRELSTRVDGISYSLGPEDSSLAKSLVSLLSNLHRLSVVYSSSTGTPLQSPSIMTASVSDNIFDTLKRQLSDLQSERKRDILPPGSPPVVAVETALLWSRIDEELDHVVTLCKLRTGPEQQHLPPQYDRADYEFDTPPEYEYDAKSPPQDLKDASQAPHSPTAAHQSSNEKMRLDF